VPKVMESLCSTDFI